MRWFKRDNRFYIGPVSDNQIDLLLSQPRLENGGVACMADRGKVETYVTVPADERIMKFLDSMRLGAIRA